jgi:hypothetical protein
MQFMESFSVNIDQSWLFYELIVLMAFILGASPLFFDWVQAQTVGYEVPTIDGRLDKGMASVQ